MKHTCGVLLTVWMLLMTPLAAQEAPVTLTLQNAIEIALEESFAARIQRLDLVQAEQNVIANKGRFRTSIDLDIESPRYYEQVLSQYIPDEVPVYNTRGETRWTSTLSIRQPLPTDGRFVLRSNLYQTKESVYRDAEDITDKQKTFFSQFRLEFTQPLFVPNALRLGMEQANLRYERSQRTFTQTQLEIVYSVTQSFFDLYRATRNVEIAGEDARQQEQLYDLARQKFEAGLIPEVEALQMEVDLADKRNSMLAAEGDLVRAGDSFNMDVGLPLDRRVAVRTDFQWMPFDADEERAIAHGLEHRSEIRNQEISRRLSEISLKQVDALSAIRGEISAYYDLTGVSDPFLPVSSGTGTLLRSSFSDLRGRPKNKGVTFSLSIPLWDSGVNKAQVAGARAELEQSTINIDEERRRVTRQIRAALTSLRESRNRLETLKRSEEVAQRSYEISLARFDNGDITSTVLADDRDRLTNARQQFLDAYIRYQLASADLKRQTLYDFENNRSLVESKEE